MSVTSAPMSLVSLRERDGLPAPMRQNELIMRILLEKGSYRHPGEAFYLIDVSWYMQWRQFTEGNLNAFPGPIDNSPLLAIDPEVEPSMTLDLPLNDHLVAGFDYQVLPQTAWFALKQWYGGGPSLKRNTILLQNNKLELEIYPYRLLVSAANFLFGEWDYSIERAVFYSRTTTVEEFFDNIRMILLPVYFEKMEEILAHNGKLREQMKVANPEDLEMRLHLAKYGDHFKPVTVRKGTTLESLGLYTDSVQVVRFLLEVRRPNDTWPTDSKLALDGSASMADQQASINPFSYNPAFMGDLGVGSEVKHLSSHKPTFFQSLAPYMKQKNLPKTSYVGGYQSAGSNFNNFAQQPKVDLSDVHYSEAAVGLGNLGNTCYMNSVLQCLSHAKLFTRFMIDGDFNSSATEERSNETLVELQEILGLLHSQKHPVVFPTKFRALMGKLNQTFRGYRQHDAEEFLTFLLTRLEEESSNKFSVPWKPKEENSTFVNQIFGGMFLSEITCNQCGHTSQQEEKYNVLSLAIPDQQIKRPRTQGRLSLDDCFREFIKPEQLGESQRWYCSSCNELQTVSKRISLMQQHMPEILMVQLKRFNHLGTKLNTRIGFPFESDLDLSEHVVGGPKFRLFAVVNHIGVAGGGHYTAYSKCNDSQWRHFNDRTVTVMDDVPDNLNSGAYILFFERS